VSTTQHPSPVSPLIRICCTGAVLALVLVAFRADLLILRSQFASRGAHILALVAGCCADVAYAAGLTIIFAAGYQLFSGQATLRRVVTLGCLGAACFSTLMGYANVYAVSELGQPINYQWLYYSHFMRSLDTYTAMADLVSWQSVSQIIAACLLLVLGSEGLARSVGKELRGDRLRPFGMTVAGAVFVFLVVGWSLPGEIWKSPKTQNAVVALAGSFFTAEANPVLATIPTATSPDDFLTAAARGETAPQTPYTARARTAGVQNVIVVVLESVAAQYVAGFGAADTLLTPQLKSYESASRRFTAFYAHQPSTTHSLVALLLSVFPPHSFRAVTREHPDIALPSLSAELKRRGYRTAILNAEDNRFQRSDVFLSHRGFDLIQDARSDSCVVSTEAHADSCMMDNLMRWIRADAKRPFFAVLWTVQTHYPYFSSRDPARQEIPTELAPSQQQSEYLNTRYNRYRRALRETDAALGGLFRELEQGALMDSTLVVILGDHGEAFGQHGNMFHRLLYDEEVRIPFLLLNSKLFHGEIDSTLGGTIDIAPTVMDLLGYPLPGEWQGRSLFSRSRYPRVYLFGPYSGLFGEREGKWKLVYNPIAGSAELYDLATDPNEQLNLAFKYPEMVESGRDRLAAWVQFQNRFYREHGVR